MLWVILHLEDPIVTKLFTLLADVLRVLHYWGDVLWLASLPLFPLNITIQYDSIQPELKEQ